MILPGKPADSSWPQFRMELDVVDLEASTRALEVAGDALPMRRREATWGQRVTCFIGPDDGLPALMVTPWRRAPAAGH